MKVSQSLLLYGLVTSLVSGCGTGKVDEAKIASVKRGERHMGAGMVPLAVVKVELTTGDHIGEKVECSMPEPRGSRPFRVDDVVLVNYSVSGNGELGCIDLVQ